MTMPFGYVGIEHVFVRFTAPHAREHSTSSPRAPFPLMVSVHVHGSQTLLRIALFLRVFLTT
jgi:hypothetical protein